MLSLKNKKILVMGLGLNNGGLGVCQWLAKHKYEFLVTDLRSAEVLKPTIRKLTRSPITYRLGCHTYEDFDWADVIIQNPGVPEDSPYLKYARKKGKLIINEAVLFFWHCRGNIIGITGSRGKSTTASFLYQLLKSKKKGVRLTGNIAKEPFMQIVDGIKKSDIVVAELSSWHLERLQDYKISPHIAVLTNIFPEHLNRYPSMAAYVKAKQAITKNQKASDYFITIKSNAYCRRIATASKAKKVVISEQSESCRYLKLPGEHNCQNLSLALAVTQLLGFQDSDFATQISHLKGLPFRLQVIKSQLPMTVINDSASTSPDALTAAVQALRGSRILLLTGGVNKNLSYRQAAASIKSSVSYCLLLPGTASDDLKRNLRSLRYPTKRLILVKNLQQARREIGRVLKSEKFDYLLFSPGAASFNLFLNEFDRGHSFNRVF